MKYKKRTNKVIKENFLIQLLEDRNILVDVIYEDFFNPTKKNLIDYNLLDNIQIAADVFEKHIKNGSRIYLVVDSDVD